jgi:hypothetical protein
MVSMGYANPHTIAKWSARSSRREASRSPGLVGRSSSSLGIVARLFSLVALNGRDTRASNDVAQGADFTIRNRWQIGTKPRR